MTESRPPRRQPDDASNEDKAKLFEEELNDFFKDRALPRPAHVSDTHKNTCSTNRSETAMSGCCMTGCPDCPWGYKTPLAAI